MNKKVIIGVVAVAIVTIAGIIVGQSKEGIQTPPSDQVSLEGKQSGDQLGMPSSVPVRAEGVEEKGVLSPMTATSSSEKQTPKKQKSPLSECARFVLTTLQGDEKHNPPVYIPGIDTRIKSLSYQRLGFDSVKPFCFVQDTPDSENFGVSTLYDGFEGQSIASFVTDYNKSYESNTVPDSSCVIAGVRNCSNQEFLDFVHQKIVGDVSQSTHWFVFSSPDYSFQIFFPTQPHLLISTKQKDGDVLSFESWAGVDDKKVMYSALAWQHETSVSPVLDLSTILEQGLQRFFEGVASSNSEAKLLSTQPTSFNGVQALGFKIQNNLNTITGRLFVVSNKSYILTYECPGACDSVDSMVFLDSFRSK